MTSATHEPIIPSGRDAVLAREAIRALDESSAAETLLKICLVKPGKEAAALELPSAAIALLKELLKELAAGRAVTVVPIEAEITTQQAAEILNVSRPFVAGLIDKGKLPGRMVGAHRRVRLEDVLAYKRDSKTKAKAALKDMIAISQDLGLE
jgi:excisionase family DNA binding protein